MSAFHLLRVNLPVVYAAPGVEDVSQNKGDKDGNVGHGFERKLAGAAVGQCQRALQIYGRRIVGCMVITGYQ